MTGNEVILDGSGSSDADGDLLQYRWVFTAKPPGSAAALSDARLVNPRFTPDLPGTYLLSLTVNDGTVDSAPVAVVIDATTSNVSPIANAGRNLQVLTGSQVNLDGSKSIDPDGNLLHYSWSFTSLPAGSSAALSDATVVNPFFQADQPGSYVLNLVVTDGELKSASTPVTVIASNANSAPTADAGPDQQVKAGNMVSLDGSKSRDADGDLITYSWSFVSVPAGSKATLSAASSANPQFLADSVGTYVIGLTVSDGIVGSSQAVVQVIAAAANSAPVADAGSVQNISTGSIVTMDGSRSSDADGDVLRYQWSFVSLPSGSQATLLGPTSARPQFTADQSGPYVVSLVVNDGAATSAASTVIITATHLNSAPVADAGPNQIVATGSSVVLDGARSSDADGDSLSYNWSMISRPTTSRASLAAVTTAHPTFVADATGSYVFSLVVTDGMLSSSVASVTVTAQGPQPRLTLDLSTDPAVLFHLGSYQVDKISLASITFNPSAGNITDPILYDNVQNNFNFDNLYRVTTASGKSYYFRFGAQYFTNYTWFEIVTWANGIVPSETGLMSFDVVKKDVVQNGQIQVAIVGDSITWANNGQALRYKMGYYYSNLYFVGSHTDIFGFGHEGEGGDTTQNVINRLPRILPSDNYVIHIGTNDRIAPDATVSNMQTIAAGLLAKKPNSTVYFMTILPRNDTYDAKNIQINDLMRSWITSANNSRLKLLDIEPDFRNLPNWQSLLPDNLHPCAAGYDQLVSLLLSKPGPWQ